MKVSELLDELQGPILRDTSHAVSSSGSQHWSPSSLVRYLDEAHKIFAEETYCLVDERTNGITLIPLVQGQDTYDLDERVIEVRAAHYEGTYTYLKDADQDDVLSFSRETPSSMPKRMYLPPGEPRVFFVDPETNTLKVYPTPDAENAGRELRLKVVRYPLEDFIVPVDGQPATDLEPEIPKRYHLSLCEWAAYKALRNHDSDAEDIPKASTHRNEWARIVDGYRRKVRRRRANATFVGKVCN